MSLLAIYDQLDKRCQSIRDLRSDWPCQSGCDHCCRSLGESPRITEAEWRPLESAIAGLPPPRQQAIVEAFSTLPVQGPILCPLLDEDRGMCSVYDARPAACRSYGYYMSRGEGLFCQRIESMDNDEIVWGNQDTLDASLHRISGPSKALADWVAESSLLVD